MTCAPCSLARCDHLTLLTWADFATRLGASLWTVLIHLCDTSTILFTTIMRREHLLALRFHTAWARHKPLRLLNGAS